MSERQTSHRESATRTVSPLPNELSNRARSTSEATARNERRTSDSTAPLRSRRSDGFPPEGELDRPHGQRPTTTRVSERNAHRTQRTTQVKRAAVDNPHATGQAMWPRRDNASFSLSSALRTVRSVNRVVPTAYDGGPCKTTGRRFRFTMTLEKKRKKNIPATLTVT